MNEHGRGVPEAAGGSDEPQVDVAKRGVRVAISREATDIGETANRAAANPQVVQQMSQEHARWMTDAQTHR